MALWLATVYSVLQQNAKRLTCVPELTSFLSPGRQTVKGPPQQWFQHTMIPQSNAHLDNNTVHDVFAACVTLKGLGGLAGGLALSGGLSFSHRSAKQQWYAVAWCTAASSANQECAMSRYPIIGCGNGSSMT